MSKKKFDLSASDESRMNNIINTFENLSKEAKEVCLLHLSSNQEHYPRKFKWSPAENNALRLFWNRTNPDEICDAFECSYQSLIRSAERLGLHPQNGNVVTSDHIWKAIRLMELGESAKGVAELFNLEYDFKESIEVSQDTEDRLEMKQDELFGGGL